MPRIAWHYYFQEEQCLRFRVHFARTLPRGDLDRSQRERGIDALRAASKTFADKLATFEANSRTRILVRWLPLVTIPGALERRRWGRRAERFSGLR